MSLNREKIQEANIHINKMANNLSLLILLMEQTTPSFSLLHIFHLLSLVAGMSCTVLFCFFHPVMEWHHVTANPGWFILLMHWSNGSSLIYNWLQAILGKTGLSGCHLHEYLHICLGRGTTAANCLQVLLQWHYRQLNSIRFVSALFSFLFFVFKDIFCSLYHFAFV